MNKQISTGSNKKNIIKIEHIKRKYRSDVQHKTCVLMYLYMYKECKRNIILKGWILMAELELLTAENGLVEPDVEITDENIPADMEKEYENGKGDED